jgi:hypothetical protein
VGDRGSWTINTSTDNIPTTTAHAKIFCLGLALVILDFLRTVASTLGSALPTLFPTINQLVWNVSSTELLGAIIFSQLAILLLLVAFGLGYLITRDQLIRFPISSLDPPISPTVPATPSKRPNSANLVVSPIFTIETQPQIQNDAVCNEDISIPEQQSRSVSNSTTYVGDTSEVDLVKELEEKITIIQGCRELLEQKLNENERLESECRELRASIDEKYQELKSYREDSEMQSALEKSRVDMIKSQRETISTRERAITNLSEKLDKVSEKLKNAQSTHKSIAKGFSARLKQDQETIAAQSAELNELRSKLSNANPVHPDLEVLQSTIKLLRKENERLEAIRSPKSRQPLSWMPRRSRTWNKRSFI